MLDSHPSQVDKLRNPQFGANLLQIAIGDAVKFEGSNVFIFMQHPYTSEQQRRYLSSYFPPSDAKIGATWSPYRSMCFLGMLSQLAAVQRFLQSFVYLTNNDALENDRIFNAVNWLFENFDRSLFTYIFDLQTITSKIFMRKIFRPP